MNDSRLGKIAKNEKLPGLQIQKLNTDIAGALNKIQNLVLEEEEEKEACSEIHHLLFLRVARAVRFSLPLLTRAQKPAAPVRKESARLLARRSGEREKEGRRRGGGGESDTHRRILSPVGIRAAVLPVRALNRTNAAAPRAYLQTARVDSTSIDRRRRHRLARALRVGIYRRAARLRGRRGFPKSVCPIPRANKGRGRVSVRAAVKERRGGMGRGGRD
jgi:hypothetical protein